MERHGDRWKDKQTRVQNVTGVIYIMKYTSVNWLICGLHFPQLDFQNMSKTDVKNLYNREVDSQVKLVSALTSI